MIKLIIVEDEPKVKKALRTILASLDLQIEIAGEAENAFDGLRLIEEMKPDLILLDLAIPGMNGLDMIEHMQKVNTSVKSSLSADTMILRLRSRLCVIMWRIMFLNRSIRRIYPLRSTKPFSV